MFLLMSDRFAGAMLKQEALRSLLSDQNDVIRAVRVGLGALGTFPRQSTPFLDTRNSKSPTDPNPYHQTLEIRRSI